MDDQSRIVYEADAGPLRAVIMQRGSQLSLFFRNPLSGELDGPMSRIDMQRPLHLLAEYTQAALLILLWRAEPGRVALLGFGGGRLALVLQYYFPTLELLGVDIDAIFLELAQQYFALQVNQRLHYVVGDACEVLGAQSTVFDCIVMDAFSDGRDNLNHLATHEFYELTRGRMRHDGVLCVNLLRADPLFVEKAYTFTRSFQHTAVLGLKHSLMLYGSDGWALKQPEAQQRAAQLQNRHGFDVPIQTHAARLQQLRDSELPALFRRLRPLLLHDHQ